MGYLEKATMMAEYSLFSTFICISLCFIYALLWRKGNRLRIGDIVITIILIAVSSLRYDVGSDYIRYLESSQYAARRFADLHFLFSAENLKRYSYEVGYETISVLTSRLFSSKYAIFWVVSIIIYIPIIRFCRKHTDNSRIALATFLLFGFWGLTLNIMKQAIAMVIVLYVYEFLKEKKYVPAGLLTLVTISFHITALIAVVCIVIVHFGLLKKFIEPSMRNLWLMCGVGVVLRFGTQLLISVLGRVGLYSQYLTYATAGVGDETSRKYIWIGALIETLFIIFILRLCIRRKQELIFRSAEIENIISIVMIGIPFSIIGISKTLWLANRFAKFFFIFIIVLLPTLLGERPNKPL